MTDEYRQRFIDLGLTINTITPDEGVILMQLIELIDPNKYTSYTKLQLSLLKMFVLDETRGKDLFHQEESQFFLNNLNNISIKNVEFINDTSRDDGRDIVNSLVSRMKAAKAGQADDVSDIIFGKSIAAAMQSYGSVCINTIHVNVTSVIDEFTQMMTMANTDANNITREFACGCVQLLQRVEEQDDGMYNCKIIVEGKDSQLSLSYRNLYEKMKVTDVCLGCGTFELNGKVGGLVGKLLEGSGEVLELSNIVNKGDSTGVLFRIKIDNEWKWSEVGNYKENDNLRPYNYYGWTKLQKHRLLNCKPYRIIWNPGRFYSSCSLNH